MFYDYILKTTKNNTNLRGTAAIIIIRTTTNDDDDIEAMTYIFLVCCFFISFLLIPFNIMCISNYTKTYNLYFFSNLYIRIQYFFGQNINIISCVIAFFCLLFLLILYCTTRMRQALYIFFLYFYVYIIIWPFFLCVYQCIRFMVLALAVINETTVLNVNTDKIYNEPTICSYIYCIKAKIIIIKNIYICVCMDGI